MGALIPDREFVTIPAGHLVHAARPVEVSAVITEFLRGPLS
jgi:pimeloyl-ACP methyl ester carboxylesterase